MLTLVRKRQLNENIADKADYRGNADRVTCCGKDTQPYSIRLSGRCLAGGALKCFPAPIATADLYIPAPSSHC